MAKVSIKFFPNAEKKTKHGTIPVYCRIVFQQKKAEYRLNAEVAEKDLITWNERIMRFDLPQFRVNDTIDDINITFKKFIALNETNLHLFDAKKIMYTLFKKSDQRDSNPLWKDYCQNYFDSSISSKTSLTKGTKKNYRKAINHMHAFLKSIGKEKMRTNELDMKFAKDFTNYLLNEKICIDDSGKRQLKKGMSEPSALSQVKKFRTILESAIDEDFHSRNFFKKIKLSNTTPEGETLTPFQVKLLYHGNGKLTSNLILYKDIFLWSVFTGLAYHDAANLKRDKISHQENNEFRLTEKRGKTNQVYDQFLTSPALQIIEKYKDHPDVAIEGGVIPKRSNSKINLHLKIIAERLNLPVNLTTHVGRRTFRQLIGEAGIETDSIIKKLMGHSNHKNMDSRYYKVNETPLLEAKRKFELYLTSYLHEHGK
ncbi:MAG: hypothetical protein A3F72_12880 [Bacteroidetes bacterium RIFCSPLOWO2_12_FULL_35_15]|nr:MAG: hypothetical protein A3F72_12880 [Bacteroidetes bacterium RIFCSPLOWO2_12_FULL_35_15]